MDAGSDKDPFKDTIKRLFGIGSVSGISLWHKCTLYIVNDDVLPSYWEKTKTTKLDMLRHRGLRSRFDGNDRLIGHH